MEKATRKAIEFGWKPRGVDIKYWSSIDNMMVLICWQEITTDPSFWQALGKAERWGRDEYKDFVEKNGELLVVKKKKWKWFIEWHRFIDHIASGGTADEFFNNPKTNDK